MKIISNNPYRARLSNDAFYCFYFDEEPIDPIYLEEAKEFIATFPDCDIKDWYPVDDTGEIELIFEMTQPQPSWPTHYLELTNKTNLLFKLINKEEAQVQIWHKHKLSEPPSIVKIRYANNKPWVGLNDSHYPLWGRVKEWAQ